MGDRNEGVWLVQSHDETRAPCLLQKYGDIPKFKNSLRPIFSKLTRPLQMRLMLSALSICSAIRSETPWKKMVFLVYQSTKSFDMSLRLPLVCKMPILHMWIMKKKTHQLCGSAGKSIIIIIYKELSYFLFYQKIYEEINNTAFSS